MKPALLACSILLFSTANAQFGAALSVSRSLKQLQGRDPTQGHAQKPTEPSGFPSLLPQEGDLPEPSPDTGEGQVRILRAEKISRTGNQFRVEGGAHIQYRGFDIVADVVEGDLGREVFEATTGARVFGEDAVIEADRIIVYVPQRRYEAWNSNSQLNPTLLRGYVLDPVYVRSEKSWGTERELFGTHAATTTCNYTEPHFHLDAKQVVVYPGRRAIFRNVKLDVLGRTLIKVPFLSVPLNQPGYRYLPEVGQNDVDGYFIKTRYGIPLRGRDNFDARLEWFEKRGTAVGGDYSYATKDLSGLFGVYALSDEVDTLNLNSVHHQRFGWGDASIDASYQRNSFFTAPSGEYMNARATFRIPGRSSMTRLGYYRTQNSSGSFDSSSQTVTLNDTRTISDTTKTRFDLSWITSEATSSREQVDVKLLAERDLRQAVARFEYQRSIPVGEIANFFSPADRTPLLTLSSDAKRLLGDRAPAGLPFTTELSIGEFMEPRTREHVTRSAFDVAFRRDRWKAGRADFQYNGHFRQGVYSDDTAQYVLAMGADASYSLGRDSQVTLRYNYLRPYGFSPLAIDQTGRTNLISGDLSVRAADWLRIGLQSGYDIEAEDQGTRSPWQFVGLRFEANPTSWLSARSLATYDTEQRSWSSIRFDITYRPGSTYVSLGSNYDAIRQKWGNANLFIDAIKWGRTRASVLLQYNGYLEQFQAQHYALTYDLHCAEAILQVTENQFGFRPGRQISFFIRLKALPSISPFGLGTFGQPLGTGGGRRF